MAFIFKSEKSVKILLRYGIMTLKRSVIAVPAESFAANTTPAIAGPAFIPPKTPREKLLRYRGEKITWLKIYMDVILPLSAGIVLLLYILWAFLPSEEISVVTVAEFTGIVVFYLLVAILFRGLDIIAYRLNLALLIFQFVALLLPTLCLFLFGILASTLLDAFSFLSVLASLTGYAVLFTLLSLLLLAGEIAYFVFNLRYFKRRRLLFETPDNEMDEIYAPPSSRKKA